MTLKERIDAAISRIASGMGAMRIPADPTDPDLVLAECRDIIDGEPARLAAAREEAIRSWQAGECPDCGCRLPALGPHTCLATPLDATPLADDLRTLRARVAELEAQVEAQRASSQRHMNGRESYWLEQRAKWIAEHDRYAESCKWHADRAIKAEAQVAEAHERLDEFGMRRDGESATLVEGIAAMRERIDEYRAEWYRAEAQVAAARAECASIIKYTEDDGRHSAATDILEAMDEAAK